jgi:hypothetical protein
MRDLGGVGSLRDTFGFFVTLADARQGVWVAILGRFVSPHELLAGKAVKSAAGGKAFDSGAFTDWPPFCFPPVGSVT